MKNLLIIALLFAATFTIGQTNKRITSLTNQATYDGDAYTIIDKGTFSAAKKFKLSVLYTYFITNVDTIADTIIQGMGTSSTGEYVASAGTTYLKSTDFVTASLTPNLFNADYILDSIIQQHDTSHVSTFSNDSVYGDITFFGSITQTQIVDSLTDGAPTEAEINSATGLTPVTAKRGYKVTISDADGTKLLYYIESDGTDWFYVVTTKAS